MNLKEIGKVLTSKSVGTGPSSYEKRIYRAAVSQRLRNTGLVHVVSPYIAVYGNVTLTVYVYVLNEAVKTELLLVDFVGKKFLCYLMCHKNT